MVSGSTTSWQIDGIWFYHFMAKEWKWWQNLLSWAPKSLDGEWLQPWNYKMLAPWKKSYDKPRQHIKKQNISLPTKVHLVKAMVFPAVMYGCESWTVKKAECWRTDAFELWYWRRFLRVPWTARRSNQSILKEISPEYSLEGLMLKLKLQYFSHLMQRTDSFEKTLMLWMIEGRRRRGWQRMRWLASPNQWTWVWVNSGSWWWAWRPGMLQSMGVAKSQTRLSDWTKLKLKHCPF